MKRIFLLGLFLSIFTINIFSQEQHDDKTTSPEDNLSAPGFETESHNEKVNENLPILVLKNNLLINPIPFYLTDGTRVTRKEFHNMIGSVPENAKLIKQGKAWKGVMFVTLGLTAASATLDIVNEFSPAFNHNKDLSIAMSATFFTSLFSTILCAMISNGKYCKAAENYNLMVMGIPIPKWYKAPRKTKKNLTTRRCVLQFMGVGVC